MLYTILPVSLVLAGVSALLNLWLGWRVGQVRHRERISVGDGGSEPLIRRMRAHANFVESAPFALVLVALIEAATGQHDVLWVLAALFVLARIVHPFGMDGTPRARTMGAMLTGVVLAALALWAIAIPIVAQTHLNRGEPVEAPATTGLPRG